MESIYGLKFNDSNGREISFEQYKNKVVLIVNTATACGFTTQLGLLQKLYEAFSNEQFEILAFPSNNFRAQEPLEGMDINNFCERNFNTQFPIMEKIDVKGINKHPVYQYLSNKKRNGFTSIGPLWNFHKYLIDKNGYVRAYYLTPTSPEAYRVKRKIKKLLAE